MKSYFFIIFLLTFHQTTRKNGCVVSYDASYHQLWRIRQKVYYFCGTILKFERFTARYYRIPHTAIKYRTITALNRHSGLQLRGVILWKTKLIHNKDSVQIDIFVDSKRALIV